MKGRWISALALGLATFVITAYFAAISPPEAAHPVPGDMRDTIVAFEMVTNEEQLAAVIGESRTEYAELREAIDLINRADFLYMTVYSLFIAVFFWAVAGVRDDRSWLAGCALALLAGLADLRETTVLLELTQDGADTGELIPALVLGTWVKWFALGIAAALAGVAMFTTKSMPVLRWLGVAAGAAALTLTVAAYFYQVAFPQFMALGIFLVWLLQAVYAFRAMRTAA